MRHKGRLTGILCPVKPNSAIADTTGGNLSDNFLPEILNRVSDGFVFLNKDWIYTFVNDHAASLFGRKPEDLVGKHIWTEFPEGVGQPFHLNYEKAMREQIPIFFEDYYEPWDRWFENRVYPSPEGITIFFHEVTERIRTEKALAESQRKYKEIFDNAPIAIFQSTLDGRLLSANPKAASLYRYDSPEEMIEVLTDIPQQMFAHPFQRQEIVEVAIKSENFVSGEVEYFRKDGSSFIANLYMRAVRNDKNDIEFLEGFVEDISERKQAESELHKLNTELEQRVIDRTSELESFSYSVSHDLQAPLRRLAAYVQIFREEYVRGLEQGAVDVLVRIGNQSSELQQLVNGLLSLSHLGLGELNLRNVDLSDMANDITDALQKGAPERRVSFIIGESIVAKADQVLIRVVMENLLNNAWKYTSKGEFAIIEFGTDNQHGQPVYFIRDNGAGFDMRYSDKLFSPLQRLHSEDEFPGVGIGLATVRRIIERHSGKIWAEGEPGRGAIFYFAI